MSPRAVGTAEEMAANFYSMANHSAPAMFTNRRDRVDRTFKAVELVPRTRYDQLECLVVLITAYFAFSHLPPHFAKLTIKCPICGRVLSCSFVGAIPIVTSCRFRADVRKWPA
jgi:hypothetical protein